jgi:uncharacterized protein (TIGR00255 family)
MTGYGAARSVTDGETYALELKSVNHRYLKLSIKMPELLQFAESAVEKLLRSRISRGSVTYTLRVQSEGESGTALFDAAVMQRYVDQMAAVRLPEHVQAVIDLGAIVALPGVCQVAETNEASRRRQLEVISDLTSRAITALLEMRREEGQAIHRDLLGCCEGIRTHVSEVATRAPVVVEEYHERLKSRVEALMQSGELELEKEGLMREVAIYAERSDITEEIARLNSHLDQFVEICERGVQAGRTLDFLTQELLREANTVASKGSDATVSRLVVEIKGLIDRLKEQVQNVE